MQTFLPWLVLQGAWLDVNHSPCGLGSCVARVGRAALSMDEGSPRPVDDTAGGTYTCAENAVTRAPCGARAGNSRFEMSRSVRDHGRRGRTHGPRARHRDAFIAEARARLRPIRRFTSGELSLRRFRRHGLRTSTRNGLTTSLCSTMLISSELQHTGCGSSIIRKSLCAIRRTPKGESARRPPVRVRSPQFWSFISIEVRDHARADRHKCVIDFPSREIKFLVRNHQVCTTLARRSDGAARAPSRVAFRPL